MLNGQNASKYLESMMGRIKKSYKVDNTDKMRCYQIENSSNKVRIFFDAKTIKKCSFKFDYSIPVNIVGISDVKKLTDYSTAIDRIAVHKFCGIYQCYIESEVALEKLIEYFERI